MSHAISKSIGPSAASPADESPRPRKTRRWILRPIVFVLAAGILGIGWNNFGRDLVVPRKWGVVEDGKLYRSGQISSRLIVPVLRDNKIGVIVALNDEGPGMADADAEIAAAKSMGIERKVFPLSGDGTGDVKNYAAAVAAIDQATKAGKPVLVHCAAGTQRTGGVVSMYEILVRGKSPQAMLPELKRYGWDGDDNPKLLPYLNTNVGTIAELLVKAKVIEKVPDPLPQIKDE